MKYFANIVLVVLLLLAMDQRMVGQNIYVPEGLNMPGNWDAFVNPPDKSVFRMANPPGTDIEVPCGTDAQGGMINLFNNLYPEGQLATSIYRTGFSTADAGGAGNYNFLFTSGPCSNFYQNKWSRSDIAFTGVSVTFNMAETYHFCNTIGSGNPAGCVDWGNTDITLAADQYYTMNFQDKGYGSTSAIFFETSAAPVSINQVTATYDNSSAACNGSGGLVVNIVCSGDPSSDEKFYVRYSSDADFATSLFAPVIFADTTQLNIGKAVIPFSAGQTYYYYALSSTLTPIAMTAYDSGSQADLITLMANTNSGANYSYTFTTSTAANALSGYYLVDNTAGTYFPNSFAFSSLATAITALNTYGACSKVVIHLKGDYTETAPSGGIVLQYAPGVPISKVTIRRMGSAGNHPLITAWNNSTGNITAGSATTGDGIFKIVGADSVTIQQIDLEENSMNTAAGPMMEYGYALLKESQTNGVQFCTIKECRIMLNRLNNAAPTGGNEAGSVGIASLNINNVSTTAIIVTSSNGSHSNNHFIANEISNVFNGIVVKGYAASSPYAHYDQKNRIGGTGKGNTIQNYGGSGSVAAYGVYTIYQNLDSILYNTINNLAGGGVTHTNILYGIFCSTGVNASAYVTGNMISIAKGNSNNDLVAFRSSLSGTGKMEFVANTITGCSSNGGSGSFYGIYMASGTATQTITGNSIISNTDVNTTGSAFLIYTLNSGATTINVSNNTISDFSKTGAGNNIYCYYNATGGSGGSESVLSNVFTSIAGSGATNLYGIYSFTNSFTSQPAFITGNLIDDLSTGGLAATKLMGIYYQKQSNSQDALISDNEIGNLSGVGEVTGISGSVQCCSATAFTTFNNNRVEALTSTSGDVYGLQTNNSNLDIGLNTISGLTASGSKIIRGIYITGFQNVSCYQNKIYDLIAYGTSAAVYGIYDDNTASDHNFYNNYIGNLEAPESSLSNAISCFQSGVNMSPPLRIYNNTFFLNASSTGTNFGSAAVLITTNGFANTTVSLKNNILVNLSTPNGTGICAALKVTETSLGQYLNSSNNNLFYAGAPSPSKVLFHNGTNGYQDTSAFKSFVGPVRESNSVSAMPDFIQTSDGASADFLHINPVGLNVGYVDARAIPISNEAGVYGTIINIDIDWDTDVRETATPDIGADEFVEGILPVQLTAFYAAWNDGFAILSWQTASEYNSNYFAIERSRDGVSFEEIGMTAAAGYSSLQRNYSFTDEEADELGVSRIYYRLRMVDLDGSFTHSTVRWVNLDAATSAVSVYPNPVYDAATITLYSASVQSADLQLTDVSGKVLREWVHDLNKGENFIPLNGLSNMAAGVYVVHLTTGREFYTARLVKE